jgi:DNA-binding NtrC family response regulator
MFGRKKNRLNNTQSILLVDDDKGQLDVFSTWMAAVKPNTYIQTASSVQEALNLIDSQRFSLIISDYSMPHAGAGLDIFEAAIQSGISKSNFIMMSGTTDNLPDEIRLVSKGDLVALETAIQQALP